LHWTRGIEKLRAPSEEPLAKFLQRDLHAQNAGPDLFWFGKRLVSKGRPQCGKPCGDIPWFYAQGAYAQETIEKIFAGMMLSTRRAGIAMLTWQVFHVTFPHRKAAHSGDIMLPSDRIHLISQD
jgi:hypothetical protein